MLVWTQGKESPSGLLVEKHSGRAAGENRMESPQDIKSRMIV